MTRVATAALVVLAAVLTAVAVVPRRGRAAAAASELNGAVQDKPNVIWICLDAARAGNFGCYGYERPTSPNIDALAAQGVLFENCFSQASFTRLSVPSYMTGRYFPVQCFSNAAWRDLWRTPVAEERFIAPIMADNGYRTCMLTAHSWMTPQGRLWRSFQEAYFAETAKAALGYAPLEDLIGLAVPWLREHGQEAFFLYIHAMDTHWPHYLYPPYDQWCDPNHQRKDLPGSPKAHVSNEYTPEDHEFMRGLHDGSILYADTKLGQFLEHLAALGLRDDTIIIIHSDHGEALGEDGRHVEHPASLYSDEVLHVPLIMAGPGLPPGKRIGALVQNADIVPTLIDSLDLETAARPDGASLLPLINSAQEAGPHGHTFAKYIYWGLEDFGIALRGDKHKYVYCPEEDLRQLWDVPDRLGSRRDRLSEAPEAAARMEALLDKDIAPLWDEYNKLPLTTPAPFDQRFAKPGNSGVLDLAPEGAWGNDRYANDDRWYLKDAYLESCGWSEDAPPVTFRLDVPNATYKVRMGIVAAQAFKGPFPASAFAYKAQDDPHFKTATADAGHSPVAYVDLGQYDVTENVFKITLDEGAPTHWAIARELRFIPVGEGIPEISAQEQSAQRERLEALGYLE